MIRASLRIVVPKEKRAETMGVLSCLKGPAEVTSACLACRILQDAGNEDALTYVVTWETQEDLEEHLRSDRFRRLLPYIELSREPPEVEFCTIDRVRGIEFMVDVLSTKAH